MVIRGRKLDAVEAWIADEPLALPPDQPSPIQVGFLRIFEVRLDLASLGIASQEKAHLQLALWANELPLQVIPHEGWLNLELTRELLSW